MSRECMGGIHAVEALLQHAPERVVRLWVREGKDKLTALIDVASTHGIAIERCDDRALTQRLPGVAHQGIVAEFQPAPPWDEHRLFDHLSRVSHHPLILVLDGVQDPHNLGACMRSAAAAGADAVVVTKDRASGLTPAARKASAGASEWLPLVVVTNLARALDQLKKEGLWSIGLDMTASESLFSPTFESWFLGGVVLVLGGEGQGLRRLTAEKCDQLVHIPMEKTESLNVSVAAAIALFSVVRARQPSL